MVSFSVIALLSMGFHHAVTNASATNNNMFMSEKIIESLTDGMKDINMTCVADHLGQEQDLSSFAITPTLVNFINSDCTTSVEIDNIPSPEEIRNFFPMCSPFKLKRFPDGQCKGFLKKKKSSKSTKKSKAKQSSIKVDSTNEFVDVDSSNEIEDGVNKYAWGGDCSSVKFEGSARTVCVMVHSAGTVNAIAGVATKPVFTIRAGENIPNYDNQEIIAKVKINDFFIGLRSAEVWKINFDDKTGDLSSVEVLVGDVTRTAASLYKYTIYIEKFDGSSDNIGACTTNTVTKEVLVGPNSTSNTTLPGTTIRSLRRLPGSVCGGSSYFDGGEDTVVFAVFSDSFAGGGGSAAVYVYDPNIPAAPPLKLDILGGGSSLTWDFELEQSSGKAYYVIASIDGTNAPPFPTNGPYTRINAWGESFTDLRYGNFDIVPKFYFGEIADLCVESDVVLEVTEFEDIARTNIGSAGVIEPLGDGNVLYCSLSGFLYQGIAGAALDSAFSAAPDFRPTLPNNSFEGVEIGYQQECFLCKTDSASCDKQFIPRFQNELSTYIWSATECGGKVFIGTLDATNILFAFLKDFIVSQLPTDISDIAEGPVIGIVFNAFIYIILSILLNVIGLIEGPLNIYEFGFNVMYAEKEELLSCNDAADCSSIWQYVTTDGFSRVTDPHDTLVLAGFIPANEELGIFGYLRQNTNVEDGVRQLVCSNDKFLHIGSTSYGDGASKTYILDIESDKGNDLCPAQEFITSVLLPFASQSLMMPI